VMGQALASLCRLRAMELGGRTVLGGAQHTLCATTM
jgi:hypothetical protein